MMHGTPWSFWNGEGSSGMCKSANCHASAPHCIRSTGMMANSRRNTMSISWEQDGLPYVSRSGQDHQESGNTKAPAGVRRCSESESIGVESEVFWIKSLAAEILFEDIDVVLSLSSTGHFITTVIEVKSATELLSCDAVFTLHMVNVEWFHFHWPSR